MCGRVGGRAAWEKVFLRPTKTIFRYFYPTALKGCRGIVFTHGVRMCRGVGGWAAWENFCLGCISETVRCRKFILGRDIG